MEICGIEEAIKIVKKIRQDYNLYYPMDRKEVEAIETLLTAYEKEKRLAEANLKDSEEFQDNMCNHRCILNSKVEELKAELEKEKEKNNNVLGLIFEYGQTDGEHHKAWVIDQIVRIITENNYDKWVQHYEYDEETDEDYFWDVGIAP